MYPVATIKEAEKASWLIKICPGSGRDVDPLTATSHVLDTKSIGIHFGVIQPLHGENETEIRQELKENYLANGFSEEADAANPLSDILTPSKRFPKMINDFVNSMEIGDEILLGIGEYGDKHDLYVAEIAGDQYFTNEDRWCYSHQRVEPHKNYKVGYYLRRPIKNIRKLPRGSKWEGRCISTIKKRPSARWGITISQ